MIGRRVRWRSFVGLVGGGGSGGAGVGLGLAAAGERIRRVTRSSFVNTDGSVEIGAGFNQCPDLTVNVSPEPR